MNAPNLTSSNPFATRWVRPGAIAYRFAESEDANVLVDRLRALAWRGQIIGPHGVGKSTLLASLIEPLKAKGRQPVLVALRDGQRTLGVDLSRRAEAQSAVVVIADGYEQLGWWSRFRLRRLCGRRNWGLLVTAHTDVGLPTICEVRGDLAAVQSLVRDLLPAGDRTIGDADVAAEFDRQGGNVRETLFGLYDVYQRRRLAERGKPDGAT